MPATVASAVTSAAVPNAGYEFTFEQYRIKVPFNSVLSATPAFELTLFQPWPAVIAFGSVLAYVLLVLFARYTTFWRPVVRANGKLHHALLFVYSTFVCGSVVYHVVSSGEAAEFIDYLTGQVPASTQPRFYCRSPPEWLRLVSISFTLSKIWEWGDTLVLISQNKGLREIGFLHLYHHATTFMLFTVISTFPLTEKLGMMLNGFVHLLMYYHFAFRLPKILRPVITFLQIVQLGLSTYGWSVCAHVCDEYKPFRATELTEYWLMYLTAPVYLLFFIKFFFEQYLGVGGGKDPARKSKPKNQ